MPGADIRIREVTRGDDPAIEAFGALQNRAYFEPDMLIPPEYLGRMLAWSDSGRRNLMLVAERAGEVVVGTVFHSLGSAGTGFSSFMATAPEVRGQGVARLLHEARFAALDRAAGHQVPGVFIDVVAPQRLSPEELEAERAVGSDPTRRRQVFGRLGFRRVDVRYEQPVGGPGGGPVTNMDLLYCPREPMHTVPLRLVLDTMRAYWMGWLGEKRTERAVRELEERAGGREEIGLMAADS